MMHTCGRQISCRQLRYPFLLQIFSLYFPLILISQYYFVIASLNVIFVLIILQYAFSLVFIKVQYYQFRQFDLKDHYFSMTGFELRIF